jgi:hypothetical protein
MNYSDFLESKRHKSSDFGINPKWIPNEMLIIKSTQPEYAIRKGRCAVFLDTGLGKTIIELTTAVNYMMHTSKTRSDYYAFSSSISISYRS